MSYYYKSLLGRQKVYNLFNRFIYETVKILRKNQNGFRRNRSTTFEVLTIRRIIKKVRAKTLETTILFVDLSKSFDSILREKMEQILLPKKTFTATIHSGNPKVNVHSPDEDTDIFRIAAGVLPGDT